MGIMSGSSLLAFNKANHIILEIGSCTSALTKLTSRRNFLKDRRSQVANELHNIDKGREYGHSAQNPEKGKGSEFLQPLPSPNKSGGSEIPSVSNPEKGRGSGSSLQMADKSSGNPGQSLQNLEKMRKSESHPAQHSERWNQHPQHLNRGKSEGHNSYNVDKGR